MSNDAKMKLDSLLTDAMNAEAEAMKFYMNAAEKAASNAGRSLFKELADFEQGHYERIKKIIESRNTGMVLKEITPSEEILVKSEVEGQFEPNKDEIINVLSIGIEAEKKAREKYLEIAKVSEDEESKNMFNNIAEEERKHQSILENQFYSLSNTGKIIWGD
ncbi:MAG: ferritin family protein [candidate division WOR-3 bacterium]|nr:MAG: ferritin family protein [candidate division WOR-3 bacterium]